MIRGKKLQKRTITDLGSDPADGVIIQIPARKFLGFCEVVDDYTKVLDDGVEVFGFT